MTRRAAVIFAAIFALTALFDQTSKAWARDLPVRPADCSQADLIAHKCAGVPQPVIDGYWDWELAMNDGAAFSNFRGQRVVLALIAMAALILVGVMAWRAGSGKRLYRVALAIIAGGILGNLVDRVRDGAVTDFVRWRIQDTRWPIFNVADVALIVGVGLLLIESALSRRRPGTLAA